jgi:hypothetical protein
MSFDKQQLFTKGNIMLLALPIFFTIIFFIRFLNEICSLALNNNRPAAQTVGYVIGSIFFHASVIFALWCLYTY